jgi:putative endopeptidase
MDKLVYLGLAIVFSCAIDRAAALQRQFVDVAGLDPAIKPSDNFFHFVNGRWSDTAKIASDQ